MGLVNSALQRYVAEDLYSRIARVFITSGNRLTRRLQTSYNPLTSPAAARGLCGHL